MSLPTIEQLLTTSSVQLVQSDSALLDVQIILAHVLNVSRSHFYTWPDQFVEAQPLEQFNALFERRLSGEPIAYIVGEQEFWSLSFKVSSATLIPRPDTEVLVETVLNHVSENTARGIDLGTGTGAIALSLAHEMPQWTMLGLDYSEGAVALAESNRQHLQLANAQIIQSDWLSKVDESWLGQCDFIVSNPPYIDENDPHLSQGDVRFEPSSALVAANNGLQDYIDILTNVKPYLKAGGKVFFEHGFQQAKALRVLFQAHGFSNIETVVDYGGNDRVTFGQFI